MLMQGTIVNVIAIIIGSIIGGLLKQKFSSKYQEALFTSMGMCALIIGICTVLDSYNKDASLVLLIINMAIGSLLGTFLNLHDKFIKFSDRFSKGKGFGEGLVTAILLFCIGTLSIVGPMESALNNNNTLLYTNASLDFITSIALSASFGIGIALAAIVLFCFQGSIYLISSFLSESIPNYILNNITLTGGVLIVMSGLCLLKLKNIKTTDYLIALAIAPITSYIAKIIQELQLFNY